MNDQSEIEKIERRLKDTINKLHQLAPAVGAARQIREFVSDQRKNILAAEAYKHIQNGESVAAAEYRARTSPVYLEKFAELQKNLSEANRVIAEWEASMCEFEACRSLLAMNRETLRTLEG